MAGLMVFAWVFVFILAVLWFLMPFAVFGTKGMLKQLLEEQKRTNHLLEEAAARAAPSAPTASP